MFCRSCRRRMTKASFAASSEPGPLLIVESATALAAVRLLVLLVPFRVYSRSIGHDGESPAEAPEPDVAHGVSRALQSVSRHTPWRSKCLEQALAAKAMLRR